MCSANTLSSMSPCLFQGITFPSLVFLLFLLKHDQHPSANPRLCPLFCEAKAPNDCSSCPQKHFSDSDVTSVTGWRLWLSDPLTVEVSFFWRSFP